MHKYLNLGKAGNRTGNVVVGRQRSYQLRQLDLAVSYYSGDVNLDMSDEVIVKVMVEVVVMP